MYVSSLKFVNVSHQQVGERTQRFLWKGYTKTTIDLLATNVSPMASMFRWVGYSIVTWIAVFFPQEFCCYATQKIWICCFFLWFCVFFRIPTSFFAESKSCAGTMFSDIFFGHEKGGLKKLPRKHWEWVGCFKQVLDTPTMSYGCFRK